MKRRHLLASVAALGLSGTSWAQNYPSKAVRLVVPYAPGGGLDVFNRPMSIKLAELMGQSVVIENRAGGAAGLIGAEASAKAAPDGYTIMIHSNAHVIAPSLVARMPYDPIADFAPVAHLGRIPQVLVINRAIPATDMQSLITWLRANSGKINFASAGIGSANHLTSEVFRAALPGVEMQMVQYRGGGPAMAAVISGEAHMAVDPTASATSHIRAGTVRPIAISGSQRVASLPEIPAATEAGLPAWSGAAWIGAFAPAQTPRGIVESLNVTFNAAMERIKPRLVDVGIEIEPQYASIAAFSAYVREELARSAAVLRAAGVKPE